MAGKPRVTKQKQLIMAILKASAVPLTAGEIYERAWQAAAHVGEIHRVPQPGGFARAWRVSHGCWKTGKALYEAVRPHEHKHYMICKGCNAMVDLPACPLHALEEEIAGAAGFTVTDHVIQLYGYCKDCREGWEGRTVRIKIGRPR